jgi:hypothetical protein
LRALRESPRITDVSWVPIKHHKEKSWFEGEEVHLAQGGVSTTFVGLAVLNGGRRMQKIREAMQIADAAS